MKDEAEDAAFEREVRIFNKLNSPNSGVRRLLEAHIGPEGFAMAEAAAREEAERGFDPSKLVPSREQTDRALQDHIAACRRLSRR